MHLFRLSCTSHLSLKSASPAQLLWSNSSSRCHPEKPGLWEVKLCGEGSQSAFEFLDRAEACSLFALQSCVLGCEGYVADVSKTV